MQKYIWDKMCFSVIINHFFLEMFQSDKRVTLVMCIEKHVKYPLFFISCLLDGSKPYTILKYSYFRKFAYFIFKQFFSIY
jgi:hypothetical protein